MTITKLARAYMKHLDSVNEFSCQMPESRDIFVKSDTVIVDC
jgi:hypothetical protein